jgi:mRNA interferase RelE/StbE
VAYSISLLPAAQSELGDLPKPTARRVVAKIAALAGDPRPPGCKALQGKWRGLYRLRVGNCRIIYRVDDSARTVLVVKIGNRSDVYG